MQTFDNFINKRNLLW